MVLLGTKKCYDRLLIIANAICGKTLGANIARPLGPSGGGFECSRGRPACPPDRAANSTARKLISRPTGQIRAFYHYNPKISLRTWPQLSAKTYSDKSYSDKILVFRVGLARHCPPAARLPGPGWAWLGARDGRAFQN